jgi:hypothetical protein
VCSEQRFHRPAIREHTRIPDTQAVFIDANLHGRAHGVVAVDEGVQDGFTQGGIGHRVALDALDALISDRGLEVFGPHEVDGFDRLGEEIAVQGLVGVPLPGRPIDGRSLRTLLNGTMTERAAPICFWDDVIARHPGAKPYLDPELQKGTTPLVKLGPDGTATRDFQNYHHEEILPQDYAGPRAVVGNRYKLVVDGTKGSGRELFDLRADPAEKNNLIATHAAEAEQRAAVLQTWQRSVLESLTGTDYR